MKILIITTLVMFIIATGAIMYFTGTFKQIFSQDTLLAEDQLLDQTQEAGENLQQTSGQENGNLAQSEAEQTQEKKENPQQKSEYKSEYTATLEAELQAKLAEYEAQISEKSAELAAIKAEIEALNSTKESITKSQQLAKLYSSMKPDSAASILCELEEPLTKQILSEMSDRTAGKIMDAIATANPSYAITLSELIAAPDKS